MSLPLVALNARSFFILHHVIDVYLETGLPVGSQTLSKRIHISSATIRNVMADLEEHQLLMSPHRSAGRLPTPHALRLYAQKIIYDHPLSQDDHSALQHAIDSGNVEDQLGYTLADLCQCASLYFSFHQDPFIHSLDFIYLSPGKAAAILVTQGGRVDRRIIPLEPGVGPQELQEASNYLNARVAGRSLLQSKQLIEHTLESQENYLHDLSRRLLHKGLLDREGSLSIKGHSHLLNTVQDVEDLQTFKSLFSWLETQKVFYQLLDRVVKEQSLQIFFGIEAEGVHIEQCAIVLAPFQTMACTGVVGVIGPLHMDYRRIIPIIDKTAMLVERTIVP